MVQGWPLPDLVVNGGGWTWWNILAIVRSLLPLCLCCLYMFLWNCQQSNCCLVRVEDQFHATQYVSSYDGLTLSGNHFRRVRDVDMKRDYAFVEFSDPRDADDARYSLDGRDFDGHRIIVEFAKGTPRGPGGIRDRDRDRGDREYGGRGPAPCSGRCFNCGIDGHWARDCKAGDWKNKCYRCGERGHIERSCPNSPKKLKRGRSYSRSPLRSRSPRRGRSRSRSLSSYSRSRSPVRRVRDVDYKERRSVSPGGSSPEMKRATSKRSPTPVKESPRERGSPSPSPRRDRMEKERDPKETSRSPSFEKRYNDSPYAANGGNRSPSVDDDAKEKLAALGDISPRDERSPSLDDDDDAKENLASPGRGSESPST